jgi:hypothetical protein
MKKRSFKSSTGDAKPTDTSLEPGSAKGKGREPKCCLDRVFNFKLGCFASKQNKFISTHAANFRVENMAKVLSC